jgi:hypothetical protein
MPHGGPGSSLRPDTKGREAWRHRPLRRKTRQVLARKTRPMHGRSLGMALTFDVVREKA